MREGREIHFGGGQRGSDDGRLKLWLWGGHHVSSISATGMGRSVNLARGWDSGEAVPMRLWGCPHVNQSSLLIRDKDKQSSIGSEGGEKGRNKTRKMGIKGGGQIKRVP